MTSTMNLSIDTRDCETTGEYDPPDDGEDVSRFSRVTIKVVNHGEPYLRADVHLWGTPAELFGLARRIDRAVAAIVLQAGDPSPDDLAGLGWWQGTDQTVGLDVAADGTILGIEDQ